jgi:hypothetical protein
MLLNSLGEVGAYAADKPRQIKSNSYEIGKKLSPTVDTITIEH